MSGLDLDALVALEAAATPGPWHQGRWRTDEVYCEGSPGGLAGESPGNRTVLFTDRREHSAQDAALIVALRNAAPALIAAARDRDRWHDAAFAGQAHEAQLTAERDAAQAALARVEALHAESWECGNLSHTNPAVGCPECDVVCRLCGDSYPCATIRALRGEELGS